MSEAINPNTLYSHDDLERMVGAYTVRVWREHGLPYLPGFYGILGINLIEFLQSNHEAEDDDGVYPDWDVRILPAERNYSTMVVMQSDCDFEVKLVKK